MAAIVRALQKLQKTQGYLGDDALRALSERIDVPLHRLHEVASFFPHFKRERPVAGAVEVELCQDMACRLRGSKRVQERLGALHEYGEKLKVHRASCLGRCDRAPAAEIVRHFEDKGLPARDSARLVEVDPDRLVRTVRKALEDGTLPGGDSDADGPAPDWTIDIYSGESPKYEALRCVSGLIRDLRPEEIVEENPWDATLRARRGARRPVSRRLARKVFRRLDVAGLLGMGGAGGRTFKKWREVYEDEDQPKYVVCNADESEPGTFKDREILLRAPHLVLEGMVIAGLVVGAEGGYVYVRHEYEEQIEALEAAIAELQETLYGPGGVLEGQPPFPLEVFVSPGGYICGEQTALIEVLEDKRAEPRNRPPNLQTNGLWNQPTLLNNVETFAWVPTILLARGEKWAQTRARARRVKGRRLFSISGDVANPGVYEVSNGILLRELLDRAGGVRGANGSEELKAFASSGPSGGFLPRFIPETELNPEWIAKNRDPDGDGRYDILNFPLHIGVARRMGRGSARASKSPEEQPARLDPRPVLFDVFLGGGLVVYSTDVNMVDQAIQCLEFYRNESCGKCVPCRVGSQRLWEMAKRLDDRRWDDKDQDLRGFQQLVDELSTTMIETAICGLGAVAANPLRTLLQFFREDLRQRTGFPRVP